MNAETNAARLGRHIRHAIPNKEQWDAVRERYQRIHGGANEIGLVSDMVAFFLVFLQEHPAPSNGGGRR